MMDWDFSAAVICEALQRNFLKVRPPHLLISRTSDNENIIIEHSQQQQLHK